MGRLAARMAVIPGALLERARRPVRRRPEHLRRVLIAHHLQLADTIALTPLLAKLRALHPGAEIVMTVPRAFAPLYEKQPYGVVPIAFDPADLATLAPIFAGTGFDLAIVPGDSRYSWLALAAGARWIVGHEGDTPGYKNWFVDERHAYPSEPAAWGDIVAGLAAGLPAPPYRPTDWPDPDAELFDMPRASRYAVLHVGASSMLKLWEPKKWTQIAMYLADRRLQPVLVCGAGEEGMVARIDPERRFGHYPGTLTLEQVWRLLRGAKLLVAHGNGIAHLGRLVGVPTVALFGPGSAVLAGAGSFWRTSPFRTVTVPDFECRDQRRLFRRDVEWVRRCARTTKECTSPKCMQAIDVHMARHAIDSLVGEVTPP